MRSKPVLEYQSGFMIQDGLRPLDGCGFAPKATSNAYSCLKEVSRFLDLETK